jgi:hypothetical protein
MCTLCYGEEMVRKFIYLVKRATLLYKISWNKEHP